MKYKLHEVVIFEDRQQMVLWVDSRDGTYLLGDYMESDNRPMAGHCLWVCEHNIDPITKPYQDKVVTIDGIDYKLTEV